MRGAIMSIKAKITALLITAAIGLALILGSVYYAFSELYEMDRAVVNIQEAEQLSDDIVLHLQLARYHEQSFMSYQDLAFADLVEAEINELQHVLAEMRNLTSDTLVLDKLTELESYTTQYLVGFDELVANEQAIGLSNTQGLTGRMQEASSSFQNLVRGAGELEVAQAMLQLRIVEKEYLIRPIEQRVREFERQSSTVEEIVKESEILDDSQKEMLIRNLGNYERAFLDLNRIHQDQESQRATFDRNAQIMNEIVNDISTELSASYLGIQQDKQNLMSSLSTMMYIISGIIFIILVVSGIFLVRSISKSISSLQEGATIIGNGDFTYRVNASAKDEMGALARTFNDMSEKVQRSFTEVNSAAVQLSSASETLAAVAEQTSAQTIQVNQAIEQVAVGAQNQTESLEKGTELVDDMSQHLYLVNEQTEGIATQANKASEQSKQGLEHVKGLEVTSKEFITLATTLINNIKEVANSSKHVVKIVETIEEISDSTDLLALNAAIESARAGEAGRGFAVVASEIRKLAEKTKGEANNIHQVIKQMNDKMDLLNEEAGQLGEYSDAQNKAVNTTRASFDLIVADIDDIDQRIDQIQEALQEVNKCSDNLMASIQDISAISEQSAASAEEVSASSDNQLSAIEEVNMAAQMLQDLSQQLIDEVKQFKIESDGTFDLERTEGTDSAASTIASDTHFVEHNAGEDENLTAEKENLAFDSTVYEDSDNEAIEQHVESVHEHSEHTDGIESNEQEQPLEDVIQSTEDEANELNNMIDDNVDVTTQALDDVNTVEELHTEHHLTDEYAEEHNGETEFQNVEKVGDVNEVEEIEGLEERLNDENNEIVEDVEEVQEFEEVENQETVQDDSQNKKL